MHKRRALSAAALIGGTGCLATVVAIALSSPGAPALSAHPAAQLTGAGSIAEPSASATAEPSALLAAAVSGLVAADHGHVSVEVENLGTGVTTGYNAGAGYATASIVKVDILLTLLYQDQLGKTAPSAAQRTLITSMIENSDNDAAQHLFEDEGGTSAISTVNIVFGMTDTVVQKKGALDEAGYSWGDTTTSALDQVKLLRQIFTSDSVLTPANRDFVKSLMAKVESDQRWGVSAAADDPSSSASDYLVKNGWLTRKTTDLWEINSIGEVEHGGQQYLVAVLSSDNATMESGIDVVQRTAEAAVDSLG